MLTALRSATFSKSFSPSFIEAFDGYNLTQKRDKQFGYTINWQQEDSEEGVKRKQKYRPTPRQREHPEANRNSRYRFGQIHKEILEGKKPPSEVAGMAFNPIPRKKHLMKPEYTVEEQIAYMYSKAYLKAYGGMEIWRWWKRQGRGQSVRFWHKPRLRCLDKYGILNMNNACPVCRDEYLFFDYRNPLLIEQFLIPSSMQPLPILKCGLCIEQYIKLKVELLKAKEHCTIDWGCESRFYDFKELYGDKWTPTERDLELEKLHWYDQEERRHLSRGNSRVEFSPHEHPLIAFDPHNKDQNNWWDIYWERHIKFAKGPITWKIEDPWKPKDDDGIS